jgi:hypothetical protein
VTDKDLENFILINYEFWFYLGGVMRDVPLKTADEYDALTQWKKYVNWEAGIRKKIKVKFNRRARRAVKIRIKAGIDEYTNLIEKE